MAAMATDPDRGFGIAQAAWQFEDSLMETVVRKYPSRPEARLLHLKSLHAEVLYNKALLAMLILTVFECPAWCDTHISVFEYIDPSERCHIVDEDRNKIYPLLSGVAYLPPLLGVILEVGIMWVLGHKILLEKQLQVEYFEPLNVEYHSMSRINVGLAMLVLEAFDIIVFVAFRPRWRLAFISRTGYLCLLPAVRNLFRCIGACVSEMASVAVFLLGAILFFAWIALIAFKQEAPDPNNSVAVQQAKIAFKANEGFNTLSDSLNTMFIGGVSDDFVVVFLKSYTTHRWVGILWLIFLVIAHVLLLSLVLDTLVAAYKTFAVTEQRKINELKVKGMMKAFSTLRRAIGEEEVSKEGFLEFIQEFSKSPRVQSVEEDNAERLFKAIDKDGGGTVDRLEFCDICGVIQTRFWTTRKYSFVYYKFPHLWKTGPYKTLVKWVYGENLIQIRSRCLDIEVPSFDDFMNALLLVNLVLVIMETYYDLNRWQEPNWMSEFELTFSFVYVGEMLVKLSVLSWAQYTSSTSNCFDFVTTWLLVLSSVVERMFEGNLSTYMNMLRCLRLLRVVKRLKNYETVQFMASTVTKLVVEAQDMMILLSTVLFFFTTMSVQVLGGLLYEGNEHLEGSEYEELKFFVFNYNDTLMSFGAWVVMLLQEYQPNFPDAAWRVTGSRYAWSLFPIFYVCGVSIVFELVKAFTIEVFLKLQEKRTAKKERLAEAAEAAEAGEQKEELAEKNSLAAFRDEFIKSLGDDMALHPELEEDENDEQASQLKELQKGIEDLDDADEPLSPESARCLESASARSL